MVTTPSDHTTGEAGAKTGGSADGPDGRVSRTSPTASAEPAGAGQHAPPVAHAKVASSVPGRIRVRVHHQHRHRHVMQSVEKHLVDQPGIQTVETNTATGSVVVSYDPEQQSPESVLGILRDIGVIVGDVMHAEDELPGGGEPGEQTVEEAIGPVGHSRTALTMVDAVDDLNRRLHRFTGGVVDLKLLFPLSMGAIGVTKVLRDGFQWGEIPGYVLMWYAFDAFYKLHRQPPDQLVNTATVRAAVESQTAPAETSNGGDVG